MKILSIDTKPTVDPYHADTNTPTTTELWIDPRDCTVWVEQGRDTGATPANVWHGRTFVIRVYGYPVEDEIREWLEDHEEEITAICQGHTVEWNGQNMVGVLTDEARIILERLESELDQDIWQREYEWWLAEDWVLDDERVENLCGKSDEEIKEIAEEILAEIPEYTVILDDLESYLIGLRDWNCD